MFFMTHQIFAPADVVLQSNVMLLEIGAQNTTFVEVDSSSNVLNVRKYPFFSRGLVSLCERVIDIPNKYFYDLVDQIDVSGREVVWLSSTGRCGSTAWCQIFNSLPGWSVISESHVPFASLIRIFDNYRSIAEFSTTPHFEKMVKAIVTMSISKLPKGNRVLWKMTFGDAIMTKVISKVFPKHKILFAYRKPLEATESLYKSAGPFLPQLSNTQNPLDFVLNKPSCPEYEELVRKGGTTFEWCLFQWASTVLINLDAEEEGVQVTRIRYEDMLLDTEGMILRLFDHLNVSEEYLNDALEALKYDSQEHSVLSRKRTALRASWKRDQGTIQLCNKILNNLGLPNLHSDYIMPNSI